MKTKARAHLVAFAVLALLAVSTAAAQPARQGVPVVPSPPPIQGFNVVLILGSESPQKFTSDLPAGATRALSDLRDFLPYRSYRMLDSAWVLNPGSGRTTARLRGVDEHHYQVNLDSIVAGSSRVTVKFALRDAEARPREEAEAARALADSLRKLSTLTSVYNANHPAVMEQQMRVKSAQSELDAARARAGQTQAWPVSTSQVIDTGFTMDVGETVVVGTSRLQGDTALIVLLTAVPKRP